ncbi:MAG TPA: tetratricopeptide repeat protein [Pyrodictiaceae archaeon]|nr:tetratricopeptide repeat protein [Pyrodictiaceae archaeon]
MEFNLERLSARDIVDLYIKEGNRLPPSQAIYLLKRAIEKDPYYEEPYIHLSRIYRKLDNIEKAKETLNILKMLNPYRSYPYTNLAKIYADQGEIEKAINILKEGIKRFEEVNLPMEFSIDLYNLAIRYSIYNWKDDEAEELIKEAFIKYKNSFEAFKRLYKSIEELELYDIIYNWLFYLSQIYSLKDFPLEILESFANASFETENEDMALKLYEYLKEYLESPLKKFETDVTMKLRFDYTHLFLELEDYETAEKLMKAALDLNVFGDYALSALEILKDIYLKQGKVLKLLNILEKKVIGKYSLNMHYLELILDILDEAYKLGYKDKLIKLFGGLLASTLSYESKKLINDKIKKYFTQKEKNLIDLYKLHYEGVIKIDD